MIKITDAIDGALLSFGTANSQSTERIYRNHLNQLAEYLEKKRVVRVDELTPDLFLQFFAWLKTDYVPNRPSGDKSPYAPASLANAWCALRMFDKFLSDEFDYKPMTTKLVKPKWKADQIIPFTKEQFEKLLEATKYTVTVENRLDHKPFRMERPTAKRDYFLFLLMLDTGLRVGEVSRLNVSDYNQTTGEIRVRPYGTGRKTKPRTVCLGKVGKRAAWRYLAERSASDTLYPNDPLFVTNDGRKRMDIHAIHLICRRAGERCGVDNCHAHRFRHTFVAIEYLRNGGNIYVLSEKILDHSNLTITRRYLNLVDEDAFNEHRRTYPVCISHSF